MKWSVAAVWLASGLLVVHPYYRQVGSGYLVRLGLPGWVMGIACLLEVILGLRMAALPCVFSVSALLENQVLQRGAMTAYELLGAQKLLEGLLAEGYQRVYAEGSTGSSTTSQRIPFVGNEREGQS